jgi:predicted metal-dependent hydrolase
MIPVDALIRSSRKTIALIITAEGKLVVRAPLRASRAQIDTLINEKETWIRARQAEVLVRPRPGTKSYKEGEPFLFLGQAYPLHFSSNGITGLELRAGAFWMPQASPARAAAAFTAWYQRQARAFFAERLHLHATRLGLRPAALRISSARTRWGSCSSHGSISFTWRLVMAPVEVIDYVVVHECIHLVVKNHSKTFWQRVAAAYPVYLAARRWLSENNSLGMEFLNQKEGA